MDAHLYGAVDDPAAARPARLAQGTVKRAAAACGLVALWSLTLVALGGTSTVLMLREQSVICTDKGQGPFVEEFCNEAQAPVLGGADVVAYHALQQGARAVQGKPDLVAEVDGFRFWFATVAHRDAFVEAPEKFVPFGGGFCPFALTGIDAKMPQRALSVRDLKAMGVDPDQWLLRDGRLLVFRGAGSMFLFLANAAENLAAAATNWAALVAAPQCASDALYNTQCFKTDRGTPAVGGVDVVAFFSLDAGAAPVAGSPKYPFQLATSDTRGNAYESVFYFETALSRATFAANPSKYVPQYGGFCAYGVAFELGPQDEGWNGMKGMDEALPEEGWPWTQDAIGPPTSVENWAVREGKLYFAFLPEVLDVFLADYETNSKRADARWNNWYGGALSGPVSVDCVASAYGPPVARTCTLTPQRTSAATPAKTVAAACLAALDGVCGQVQGANPVGALDDCSSCLTAHFATLAGACPATATALHAAVDKAYCW